MNTGSRSWLRERGVQWNNRGRKWRKRHREWWKKSRRLLSSFHNINTALQTLKATAKQLLILHLTWFCPVRHTAVLTSLGYFLVHQPSWGILVCWFLQVFFLYWTEHGTNNRPFCLFLSYCDCSYRALDERRKKKQCFFLSVFITLEWFCQENCQLRNSVHFWFCFFASHLFFFLNVLCLCFKHWTISIFQKNQINTTLGFCSQHSI